jgi:arsenate reductase
MRNRPFSVLILCTGNSARSVMAEALFNVLGKGRSLHTAQAATRLAASIPSPSNGARHSATTLRSYEAKAGMSLRPQMGFVITVCDDAAGEVCPVWPGKPLTAHWGFEDPAAVEGTEDEKRKVFDKVFRQILNRVSLFVNLPLHVLDRNSIQREMRAIGEKPATESDEQH